MVCIYLRQDFLEQILLQIVHKFLRNQGEEKKKHTILLRRFESLCFAAGIENFSKGDLYIGCLFFFFSALYKNFRMLWVVLADTFLHLTSSHLKWIFPLIWFCLLLNMNVFTTLVLIGYFLFVRWPLSN